MSKRFEFPTFVQHLWEMYGSARIEISQVTLAAYYQPVCKISTKSQCGIMCKNGTQFFQFISYGRQILPPLTTPSNGHKYFHQILNCLEP